MKTQKKPTWFFLDIKKKTEIKTYRLFLASIFVTKTKTRNKTSHSHSINTYANIDFLGRFCLSVVGFFALQEIDI